VQRVGWVGKSQEAGSNKYDTPHRIYNHAVKEHFDRLLEMNKISVDKMTPDQARAFSADEQEYKFKSYHNGVYCTAPVQGQNKFLMERGFLNGLIGRRYRAGAPPRPIPDPSQHYYQLNDEQLEAYSAFRKKFRK
jgi:hypothetical protein